MYNSNKTSRQSISFFFGLQVRRHLIPFHAHFKTGLTFSIITIQNVADLAGEIL